jgi:hypothetical protein
MAYNREVLYVIGNSRGFLHRLKLRAIPAASKGMGTASTALQRMLVQENRHAHSSAFLSTAEDDLIMAASQQPSSTVAPAESNPAASPQPVGSSAAAPAQPPGSSAAAPPGPLDDDPAAPIPGSELLGRGIYIKAREPYEFRDLLFEKEPGTSQRLLRIHGMTRRYIVPEDCQVNESPPLPAGRPTGVVLFEESWDRFGSELKVSANAAASSGTLSLDATSFHASSLQAVEDSYYALRSSYVPLWNVYMPNADRGKLVEGIKRLAAKNNVPAADDQPHLPSGPFDPACRAQYAAIFERFGTHYVRAVWVGGQAALVLVVTKSSRISKDDIKAGIEAAFSGNKAGSEAEQSLRTERVRNNSTIQVFGSGGDQAMLAKLITLDAGLYNGWVDSIVDNPQVIQLGVAGIWTLLSDQSKAEALQQAFIQESTFTPLDSVVPVKDWIVFTKGDEAFDYPRTSKYGRPRMNVLASRYTPDMIKNPEMLRAELGALLNDNDHAVEQSPTGPESQEDLKCELAHRLNGFVLNATPLEKQDAFRAVHLPEIDPKADEGVVTRNRRLLDAAFPDRLESWKPCRSLVDYLPALRDDAYQAFRQPQAAFSMHGFGIELQSKIYLFKWRQCLRLDTTTERFDYGYPRNIADEWPDVDFDRIDAAVSVAPNRVYFFRGPEYIRLDVQEGRAQLTTRDMIKNRWPGVIFDKIDTAVYMGSNKVYFFSEDQYILYDLSSHRADPGYPKFLSSDYVEDWELFG